MGLIIIDGNSICYSSHNTRKLTVGTFETQAIYGTIRSVRSAINANPGYKVLVLWDGKSQWRRDIYPEYKGNRKPQDAKQLASQESYKKQSPLVRKGLSLLGIRQMFAYTHEADDLAGIFVQRFANTHVPIKLVTADQDWLQLVGENVEWIDPINERSVNLATFTEFTGYDNTTAFVEGKALMGDVSDNIDGIERVGKIAAAKLLYNYKSVSNFYRECDAGNVSMKTIANQRLSSPEGREIFARNMKLMSLRNVPVPHSKDIVIIQPDYNEEKFRYLSQTLAFSSITRNFDTFMQPFDHQWNINNSLLN